MGLKISFVVFILILLFIIPTNGSLNRKPINDNIVKSNLSGYNVSFPDANVLWSYPISGMHPTISSSGIFSIQGSGGIVGSNITGDGFVDFILLYYDHVNKNATLYVVDGGNGKLVWKDNFTNFITYYMEGTLGNIPLICVLTGNVTHFSNNEPFYGPGYLSINMINGLNGSTKWVVNNYLNSSNNGIFFTTNNTIFASTDPLITTYSIFTMTKAKHNILDIYNITLIGIKNINGALSFRYTYSTLSSNIYYPTYLSIDQIPGLLEGGIFYTYILMNSSGNLTSRIVLISSTGNIIWNKTSNVNVLILTAGTENAVSIAVGNFTGGLYYDLAYSFVSINQSLAYNFGIEVVNITNGNTIYLNEYGPYEDPGLGQFIETTPFLEFEFDIDNASGGYGQLLYTKNSTPLLVITLYSRTGNAIENVLALNVLQNYVEWNTTLINIGSYGAAAPFYYRNNAYVLIITNNTQFFVLNGTNGAICSSSSRSQINDPELILPLLSNNRFSFYNYVPSIHSYINKNGSSSGFQYNVTLLNIFNNATIASNEIKPFNNNNTPTSITPFTTVSYLGFKDYITASIDDNYSGQWIDNMYIMSGYNLSIAWKYTAKGINEDPLLVSSPSWNFYRMIYPQYGNLSKNANNFVFPIQTTYRFYMLELNNSGKLVSSIHSITNKGYAPLHDTFYVIAEGGLPSYYYRWYINGTYSGNTSSSFSTVFYNAGTYNVSVVVVDQLNHTSFASAIVTVYPYNKTNNILNYVVSGRVISYNNTPLSNVSIYVNSTFYVYTNIEGNFSIFLPNGTYILNFSKKGYYNYTENIKINGYNITNLTVILSTIKSPTHSTTVAKSTENIDNIKLYVLIAVVVIGIIVIIVFLTYPSFKKRKM